MNPNVWLHSFLAAMLLFQLISIPGLILKKNDLADVLWGPAFPLSALAGFYFGSPQSFAQLDLRSTLILGAITVWAVRLFFHVGLRNLSTLKEDVRYNNWRKQWGKTEVWRSYLQIFVLQPLILYIFLVPINLALSSPSLPMGLLAALAAALWAFGFLLECIADEQLRRYKADSKNKGKLMTSGLWSWSRHPNYFGEVVQWWGIWLMVAEMSWGWAAIISPIGVTFLILKVSGVDMLEDLMKNRPGFDEYAKKTSRFFLLPPKKTGSTSI